MVRMDFRWIETGRLAGCSMPGMFDALSNDLAFLHEQGIRHLVSLIETPLVPAPDANLEFHHFPIDDMGVPQPRATESLCREVVEWMESGEAVAVHCKAGIGRTGTILACCLVLQGRQASAAITAVRKVNRHYMQNDAQERFIRHFEEHLNSGDASDARSPCDASSDSATYPNGLPRLRLKLPTESTS